MRPNFNPPPMTDHVAERMTGWHSEVLNEVVSAVERDAVVVVGMAINPHVKRAKKALDDAGVAYTDLSYGSYWSGWHDRLAIKMWSGWPTFPQVFVRGTLIGGADQTAHMLEDGSLKAMLDD